MKKPRGNEEESGPESSEREACSYNFQCAGVTCVGAAARSRVLEFLSPAALAPDVFALVRFNEMFVGLQSFFSWFRAAIPIGFILLCEISISFASEG